MEERKRKKDDRTEKDADLIRAVRSSQQEIAPHEKGVGRRREVGIWERRILRTKNGRGWVGKEGRGGGEREEGEGEEKGKSE